MIQSTEKDRTQTEKSQTHDAMHDPKQPPHSVILRIISGLE